MGILLSIVLSMIINGNLKLDYKLYAETALVTEVNAKQDTVLVECSNGNLFEFSGIEDYEPGDLVGMIMCDKGTPVVYDDMILNVQYVGTVDQFNLIDYDKTRRRSK